MHIIIFSLIYIPSWSNRFFSRLVLKVEVINSYFKSTLDWFNLYNVSNQGVLFA